MELSLRKQDNQKKKRRIYLISFLYWIATIISFSFVLQIHWSPLFPLDFNILKLLIASISLVFVFAVLPDNESVYGFMVLIIVYMTIIPMGCVYVCQNGSTIYYLSTVLTFLFVEFILDRISVSHFAVRIGRKSSISKGIVYISVIILIITMIQLYTIRGLPTLSALDFSITYEIRSSYSLDSSAYRLYSISTRAIIPFLLSISLFKKNIKATLILVITQFILFLWLANKTTLFSIVVLVIGFIISKSNRRMEIFAFSFSGMFIIVTLLEVIRSAIGASVNGLFGQTFSLVVRRTLFVPAYLKQCYYEYFVIQNHDLAGLFGTVFAPVLTRLNVHNPYQGTSYARIIGDLYYNVGAFANTGIFGGELAHFGIFGIPVSGICLLAILLCVKSGEKFIGKDISSGITLYMIVSLTDAKAMEILDFSPTLVLCILLIIFETPTQKNRKVYFEQGKILIKNE